MISYLDNYDFLFFEWRYVIRVTLLIFVCFHMGSPRCTIHSLHGNSHTLPIRSLMLCELKMQFGLRPGVELIILPSLGLGSCSSFPIFNFGRPLMV